MAAPPLLWFERLYFHLPSPLGSAMVFLPFVLIIVVTSLIAGVNLGTIVPFLPFFLVVNIFIQYACRHASATIIGLADKWDLLRNNSISLDPIFGLKGHTAFALAAYAVFFPLFDIVLLKQYTLFQVIMIGVLPWIYYAYFFGSFFWVLAYSAYSINKMGKLPLKLKHFTEDRTLGLRDFGSASLRLAGLYVVFVALFVVQNALQGFVDPNFLATYIGLPLLAVPLFLFPLLSLHRRLVSEKRAAIAKFVPAYKELVLSLEAKGPAAADQTLTSQVNATRQVLQDAGQIHSWPFDTGIIVRLSAIIISVVAILLSRILAVILKI